MLERAELYRGNLDGVTAIAALQKLPEREEFNILVYTPDFCGFVKFSDGKLARLDGEDEVAPESIFELRAFCPDLDLRWVRGDENGTGRGTVLAGTPIDGLNSEKPEGDFFRQSGRYLLWGKGRNGCLFEHRTGELPVPVEVADGQRVGLNFDEYFRADKYGNRVWYAERLTGLEAE